MLTTVEARLPEQSTTYNINQVLQGFVQTCATHLQHCTDLSSVNKQFLAWHGTEPSSPLASLHSHHLQRKSSSASPEAMQS